MSAEAFITLLERSGRRVLRSESAGWYEAQPHVYQSIPFHAEVTVDDAERRRLFRSGAWVLRHPCPAEVGSPTYRFSCTDRTYDLSGLSTTARRATRRGLERCTVRRIPFAELAPAGAVSLSRNTLERQGRAVPDDHDRSSLRLFAAGETVDGAECWAAFVGTELAAYIIAVTVGDCFCLPFLRSSTGHLAEYPNNALVFTVTRAAMDRPGITETSWGLESLLPGLTGLDRFKQGMGFEHQPAFQRFDLPGPAERAVRGPVTAAIRLAAARGIGGSRVGLAAEMLRRVSEQPPRPPRSRSPKSA